MEKIRVKLERSLACPPYFGTADDVLDLPVSLALDVLEQGNGKCVNENIQADFEKAKADGKLDEIRKYIAASPEQEEKKEEEEEESPIAIAVENAAVEARVDEHLAGLNDLFNKQAENQAALAELAAENPAEAQAEAQAEAPKKKGK